MWPRSDVLAVVGLLIALVGTIAAIHALPNKRVRFWLTLTCVLVFAASVVLIRLSGRDRDEGSPTVTKPSTPGTPEVVATVDTIAGQPLVRSPSSHATSPDLTPNPSNAGDTTPNLTTGDSTDSQMKAREAVKESAPPSTPLRSLTFDPPLQCDMEFTQDAGWFQKDREGALRVHLYAITLMSTKTLELKMSICNTGGGGVEYLPFFAWYTFERPRLKTTIHWLLPDAYEATNWLTAGDCHMVNIASHDDDGANAATALDAPLGVVHFSLNNNESFCDLRLPSRGKRRRGAG